MTEKDLYKGLNHIDDELINESMKPINNKNKERWKKILRSTQITGAVAAVLAVFVLGYEVVSLNNRISKIEGGEYSSAYSEESSVLDTTTNNSSFVGIEAGSKLGELYKAAKGYGEVYDSLQEIVLTSKGEYTNGFAVDDVADAAAEEADIIETEPASPGSSSANSADKSYSTTNVMTKGVDESDIVKTDGNYIYMVESGQISITDIRNGEPGEETLFIPDFKAPSDVIHEMYVSDGKMVLITSHIKNNKVNRSGYFGWYWNVGLDEEVYCYSYDISNPSEPKLIGSMKQDGSYNTSRKVDDTVYVFTTLAINRPDMEKKDAVKENNLSSWIPNVNDTPVASNCIFIGEDVQQGMLISSFSAKAPGKTIDAKYVESGYAEIYVSNNAIYFYQTQWANREITYISKMTYDNGKLIPGESTSINGSINDKFAISQQKGYLFVIATEYNNTEVNTLHVFDETLKQVGLINEIARGELIYAARYVGNYAYFITYKQVDPLFIVDISDPKKPKIISELEVEGFSEYLHMWDDTHVLGIGYMTDKQGARKGIKYTMFDVSDPANPKEENFTVIGNDSSSDALYGNYKAILADSEKNLIGMAVQDYNEKKSVWTYTYQLLSYDSKKGFKIVKETSLPVTDTSGYRGLYSEDNFYIAGNGEIIYFPLIEYK